VATHYGTFCAKALVQCGQAIYILLGDGDSWSEISSNVGNIYINLLCTARLYNFCAPISKNVPIA
jgi:hypothetical protein